MEVRSPKLSCRQHGSRLLLLKWVLQRAGAASWSARVGCVPGSPCHCSALRFVCASLSGHPPGCVVHPSCGTTGLHCGTGVAFSSELRDFGLK